MDQPDQNQKFNFPPNLIAGLKNLSEGEAIPLFIPRALEDSLIKLELYRSSMTPTEAWDTLYKAFIKMGHSFPTPPENLSPEPQNEIELQKGEPIPPSKAKPGLVKWRRKGKIHPRKKGK